MGGLAVSAGGANIVGSALGSLWPLGRKRGG